jgi:hypothetical protein
MTGQSHSQPSDHSGDRYSQQRTYIAEGPETEQEKDDIHYPFHSQSGNTKYWGTSLDIPSSSGSRVKNSSQRSSRLHRKNERNEDHFSAGGDGDSYMELSTVTPSKPPEIKNLESEEGRRTEREDATEQLNRMKSVKVTDRSDLDIHGTGIG